MYDIGDQFVPPIPDGWTNVGDIPHTATAVKQAKWDTGVLAKGESKAITFSEPGDYYYICAPHPWMYGDVIVE